VAKNGFWVALFEEVCSKKFWRLFGPKIIDSWPSVVRSKNLSKFLDCAFSLVDLLKEVSMADFQQRLRYYLVCPLGLIG